MAGEPFYVAKLEQDVVSFLERALPKASDPQLYWFEPRVGVLSGGGWLSPEKNRFFGVGKPETIYPFEEARIFWADRALHVVSEGGASGRVMEYGEGEPLLIEGKKPVRDWILDTGSNDSQQVLLWQDETDRKRFGLHSGSLAGVKGLRVVRYLQNHVVVAWRLVSG